MDRDIVLIAHDLRSTHNVGSLLRTAEGMSVSTVWLTGYTPYPMCPDDKRLPHLSAKLHAQIHKTALGAEKTVRWEHAERVMPLLHTIREAGYTMTALEQWPQSTALHSFKAPQKIALILGSEVDGLEPEILQQMDVVLEMPMLGKKESYNVVQAAAMALFQLRFH